MKVISPPQLAWLGRIWQCPGCGALVEFEISDLAGVPPLKPDHIAGRWVARRQCDFCRTVQQFTEIPDTGASGSGPEDSGGERLLSDSGSLPDALTREEAA